jgi:hypothetical protein
MEQGPQLLQGTPNQALHLDRGEALIDGHIWRNRLVFSGKIIPLPRHSSLPGDAFLTDS